MRRGHFVTAAIVVLASAGAMPRDAHAQAVAPDAAAAEAVFAEARALMGQGKYAEACPKLEASFALDPALGTLLNLADCFERTGRTASAWVRFREAAAMAVQQNQRARETIARERAAAIEPRLCRLTMDAPDREDLTVLLDGVSVSRAARGIPLPIDPGKHVIEAQAPGATPSVTEIEITAPPKNAPCPQKTIAIPLLKSESPSAAGPPMKAIDLTLDAPPPPSSSGWSTIHTLAVVSAAGGLVGVGIGSVFGLQAASKQSDGEAKCTPAGCSSEGKSLLADAGQSADIATVSFVVGAALLTTGAILWLASPTLRSASSSATARTLGAGLRF